MKDRLKRSSRYVAGLDRSHKDGQDGGQVTHLLLLCSFCFVYYQYLLVLLAF